MGGNKKICQDLERKSGKSRGNYWESINERRFMITKERFCELLIEAGLDEKKFQQLLSKEDSSFEEMKDSDLDHVTGGES